MALLVFAALIVTAVIAISWGTTTTAASRQSQQDQVAIEEAAPESGWSITPAHLRMW
jgi:hypothetical protein